MRTEQSEAALENMSGKLGCLASEIETIRAIGVSGSPARGSVDKLSDIDLCVYVAGELPSSHNRKLAYSKLGFEEIIHFDIDFENSRGDGFLINNVHCDFNWMSLSTVQSFLKRLETDLESPEYIPGGLLNVKGLYDPDNIIPKLQASTPQYSDQRVKHRIKKAIAEVYFSFYDLGWLEKAVYRKDNFLFLKYTYNALEILFRALIALNKDWLSDEKVLTQKVSGFRYTPKQIEMRIDAIIMHQQENSDLNQCLYDLKGLFADTVKIIHQCYPDLELPIEWN